MPQNEDMFVECVSKLNGESEAM